MTDQYIIDDRQSTGLPKANMSQLLHDNVQIKWVKEKVTNNNTVMK